MEQISKHAKYNQSAFPAEGVIYIVIISSIFFFTIVTIQPNTILQNIANFGKSEHGAKYASHDVVLSIWVKYSKMKFFQQHDFERSEVGNFNFSHLYKGLALLELSL